MENTSQRIVHTKDSNINIIKYQGIKVIRVMIAEIKLTIYIKNCIVLLIFNNLL